MRAGGGEPALVVHWSEPAPALVTTRQVEQADRVESLATIEPADGVHARAQ